MTSKLHRHPRPTAIKRYLFVATAAAALAGIAIQVVVSAGNDQGLFPTAAGRVFNVFCYFTVQSNLLVAVTSLMLFARPECDSQAFRALRLSGLIAITVTFLVYHAVLAHLVDLDGWARIADQLIHTAAPLLAIAAWIVAGPRGQVTRRLTFLAALPPLAWGAFTLVRGASIDFYPYPFVDVGEHGYAVVALNMALVALLFVGLGLAAARADRSLSR